jgi:hypothetical protein
VGSTLFLPAPTGSSTLPVKRTEFVLSDHGRFGSESQRIGIRHRSRPDKTFSTWMASPGPVTDSGSLAEERQDGHACAPVFHLKAYLHTYDVFLC